LKQGIEHAWELLAACDPQDVCDRAGVEYLPDKHSYMLPVLGCPISVDVCARTLGGSGSQLEFVLKKTAYFSHLSVLHYLLDAQRIAPSGRLVNPADLKTGQIYLKGSHLLPLDRIAQRFSSDAEGFLARGAIFGGEPRAYGDAALELRPFPRVPVTIILWLEDEEFAGRSSLLLDDTCECHLPPDIIWSVTMMCALAMLAR
jgi:hypothetical protein